MQMKYCPRCTALIVNEAKKCPECGKKQRSQAKIPASLLVLLMLVFLVSLKIFTTDNGHSLWDGSNISLKQYVTSRMGNPASFEHIATSSEDRGEFRFVSMRYLHDAPNGELIESTIQAKCNKSTGVMLELVP